MVRSRLVEWSLVAAVIIALAMAFAYYAKQGQRPERTGGYPADRWCIAFHASG